MKNSKLFPGTAGTERTSIVELFGQRISNVSLESAARTLTEKVERQRCVAFLNADCINKLHSDASYRSALKKIDLKYADGVGMRLAAKLQGKEFLDNVNGTDLFPLLLKQAEESGKTIFLLGGARGVARRVRAYVEREFPRLRVAGTHHGYCSVEDNSRVIQQINESGADIVFVAMGAPKQEQWISRFQDQLSANVILGVGGLFDFYSGDVARAPSWMRRYSLEWVWRLMMQPKAKAKRYLLGNPVFVLRALIHASEERLSSYSPFSELKKLVWRQRCLLDAHMKRSIDVCASSLGLLALSPLFLLVAISIRMESRGPIFFNQTRVGKNGCHFSMYKFRSMYLDAQDRREALLSKNESGDGVIFKMKRDPRITKVGSVIRKFSIDELPQLWNVLIGQMSLVGPRPPLPSEVDQYSPRQYYRLQSKPGITCTWQISGRSDIPFEQQVELDIDYIRCKSLLSDLSILIRTIPAVVMARGAY